jgi:predicted Zn-dependent peptidase
MNISLLRRPGFLLLLFLLPLISAAQSAYTWKQAASGGYTYKYVSGDPFAARFYTLKNGLTVILSPNKKEPRVTVKIAVRTGSNNDPNDHTGLAHYLEHLLFKGTDTYGSLNWSKERPLLDSIDHLYEIYNHTSDPDARKGIYRQIDKISGDASKFSIAGEYDKMMTSLGSQRTNAHTFVEETIYEEDVPSNAVNQLLAIQSERFRNPIFRIFHTELEAVYEEKNRTLDNDNVKVQEAMLAAVFPSHNYGQQTTIGTIEHLKNPSLQAIRQYYRKYYVPNNMAIVMAGDFNPDVLIRTIDKDFSYMKPSAVQEYHGPSEMPLAGPLVKEVFGPTAEGMRLLYRTGPSNTRESVMTTMLGSVLSNGKAGLLDLNLNKPQKVNSAFAGDIQFKDYGVFLVIGSPKQGQTLEQVRDLLLEQISLLKKGAFDQSLLKAIVANSKLSRLQSLDNNNSRAVNMADEFIKNRGAKWNTEAATIATMSGITKHELVNYANKLFTETNYVVLYKRKGEDKSIVKVEKPPITPITTNAGQQSPFVKNIVETTLPKIAPVWLDYAKDIRHGKIGKAEILYVPNNQNDIFRLYYHFDRGYWNNKMLPYAAQYLQFLGTDKYSADEISKQFYNLACNFSVSFGSEETNVTLSGLQENFDKASALFEDLIHNCKPNETALAALKASTLKTRANNKLNKGAITNALRSYAIYGPQNPVNFIASDDEVKNMTSADLIGLLHGLFNHKHQVLYYGPKSLPVITREIPVSHHLPAAWSQDEQKTQFAPAVQSANKVLFVDYDAVQAEIYWIRNLDSYDPSKEALTGLFNSYFNTVVFQTIRESKALAYSAYSQVLNPGKKGELFSAVAYVGTQADKMNEAVAGMNELLNELPQQQQYFANSLNSRLKDIETDRVTKDAIFFSYLNGLKKGVTYDLRKTNYERYSKLTLEDLNRYHQEELAKKPFTYCVIASEKRVNTDDLKKLGEVQKLGLKELFGY